MSMTADLSSMTSRQPDDAWNASISMTPRLCLLDTADQPTTCRNGTDGISLPALRLGPGEHVFEIQGAAVPSDADTLRLDVTGPAPAGFEAEPNEDVASATRANGSTPSSSRATRSPTTRRPGSGRRRWRPSPA
jgi:hypothetical protein